MKFVRAAFAKLAGIDKRDAKTAIQVRRGEARNTQMVELRSANGSLTEQQFRASMGKYQNRFVVRGVSSRIVDPVE